MNDLFRTVHAHCLKCTESYHGEGAIDKMLGHYWETTHAWTFDYKRVVSETRSDTTHTG